MSAVAQVKDMDNQEYSVKLAPYATRWQTSRGRMHDEPSADHRSPFQRDRDRLIYSDAFRRLQYKTQVFMNPEEGDFRTRLTHTLEVVQLTRTICRGLGLDEDLGEAIALAHDVGHPPFGHAGEDALNDCMEHFGGFNHNVQALRILCELETPYAMFNGLNLSWEVREGVAKHNGPLVGEGSAELAENKLFSDLLPTQQASLEAQVAAVCDQVTYIHHDLDDGLNTGKLHIEDVMQLPQFKRMWEEVTATYPHAPRSRYLNEAIRRMINRQVRDIISVSRSKIASSGVQTVAEVRELPDMLIGISDPVAKENKLMYDFLYSHLYRHTSVNRYNFQAHRVVRELFKAFMNHRKMLPTDWRARLPKLAGDEAGKAQVVCDYIASLTDRSALREHARLFAPLTVV
ncbi:MAG: deoxyguanosinetriphosphate triphosphohydrolase [Alphaproteobacteria bacterium]